jgi:hypothetical protein
MGALNKLRLDPGDQTKDRSRCRSGMPPRMACVAIKQWFAERAATPAHRHRAYKCAALLGGLRALIKEFNQADFFLGTRRYPDT